eukprot:Em0003g1832a
MLVQGKLMLGDKGKEFANKLIEDVVSTWPSHVQLISGCPRHPQSQGLVEQAHYTLEKTISAKVVQCGDQFPPRSQWLPHIVYTRNTQVHETTKQTPCKLVVGQSLRAIVVPDVNFRGQLDEDILKPCDREISEKVTKDKKEDDEEKKRRVKRNKSRMMKQKRMMRKEEKEEENEEIEVEDEEKEEDDEKVVKDSGNVDKNDDEEEDEDNVVEKEMEGTYVSTVASELESNIEVALLKSNPRVLATTEKQLPVRKIADKEYLKNAGRIQP